MELSAIDATIGNRYYTSKSVGPVLSDFSSKSSSLKYAASGDTYLLSKHWVRYLASRASNGKYGAHCPKYGFPPMSRHERD